jgi:hypothetical protein
VSARILTVSIAQISHRNDASRSRGEKSLVFEQLIERVDRVGGLTHVPDHEEGHVIHKPGMGLERLHLREA